ncbi:MAG: adenylate/guanylate cyclase domain-containing protein [Bacteroidetes bacterium]|nr:adenylate/guanylate cyclase domain-containing protein [Bacteroidota bacterium]MBU1679830.1 adenylate/guanylate cyclase domain-containing protein [Bacteroidota bacterium]
MSAFADRFKKSRNLINKALLSLITSIIVIVITQDIFFTIAPIKELELNFIDDRFSQRGQLAIKDSADVIILEVTQETYDQIPAPYNSWPYPRSLFAKVTENLYEAGVKAVGIDFVMSNKDRFSIENDEMLSDVIKKTGIVVVAGTANIETESLLEDVESSKGIIQKRDENYSSIFYSADSSVGIVNVTSDYDGVYRRYQPYVHFTLGKKNVPTFGYATLNKYYGLPSANVVRREDDYFFLGDKKIPKFDNTSVLINYYGSFRSFPHYKFIDVLDDKDFKTTDELSMEIDVNTWDDPDYGLLYQDIFKDKIVLIGSTMPEDKDILPISFSKGTRKGDNLLYGVEIHANAIQNVIRGDFIAKQSRLEEILLIFFITFLSFFLTSTMVERKVKYHLFLQVLTAPVFVSLIYGVYELGIYLFIQHNFLLSIISPVFAIGFGYFSSFAYNFIRERKQNTVIKGMFSQYVSGALVDELIADPDKLQLGGESKRLTILFSDIAGFSTFSEKMTPQELVSNMNEYLSEMTQIVLDDQGTLDKYVGDAVMAFWGAPIPLENHAYLACKAALEMRMKVEKLKEIWHERGIPPIEVRIGINTGEVVVGNVGGVQRFDYTVMGDTVNLASRLEGANKQYGTYLMISETTYEDVKEHFLVRELDNITVKGRTKPTVVYQLLGYKSDPFTQAQYDSLQNYFTGLNLFKQKKFAEAKPLFITSLEDLPDDGPSKVYLDRCEIYCQNPPPEDWDGVFIMKTK